MEKVKVDLEKEEQRSMEDVVSEDNVHIWEGNIWKEWGQNYCCHCFSFGSQARVSTPKDVSAWKNIDNNKASSNITED